MTTNYVLSRYNTIVRLDDHWSVVYNSLSKKVSKMSKEFVEILSGLKPLSSISNKEEKLLIDLGYIVSQGTNEQLTADFEFLEDIMGGRLDLTIMPTEQCNFRCKYCYEEYRIGKMSSSVQERLLRYIQKNISKHNGLSVSWFGGEPTLAMDVIEKLSARMIQYCKNAGVPYNGGITTNGYNLTLELFNKLLRLNVRNFQITVDGLPEYHDRFRVLMNGEGTFSRIWKNLIEIKNNSKNRMFHIIIRVNVSKDLLPKLNLVAQMIDDTFGSDSRFSVYFRPVGDWGGTSVNEIRSSVFDYSEYASIYEMLSKNNTKLNYRMYYLELTQRIDICYAARKNSYIVGADGSLYKCSVDFSDPNNQIGEISSDGTFLIDRDKELKWISVGTHMIKKSPECDECKMYLQCHNASCVASQVSGKTTYNCSQAKTGLQSILKLLANDERYCKEIDTGGI